MRRAQRAQQSDEVRRASTYAARSLLQRAGRTDLLAKWNKECTDHGDRGGVLLRLSFGAGAFAKRTGAWWLKRDKALLFSAVRFELTGAAELVPFEKLFRKQDSRRHAHYVPAEEYWGSAADVAALGRALPLALQPPAYYEQVFSRAAADADVGAARTEEFHTNAGENNHEEAECSSAGLRRGDDAGRVGTSATAAPLPVLDDDGFLPCKANVADATLLGRAPSAAFPAPAPGAEIFRGESFFAEPVPLDDDVDDALRRMASAEEGADLPSACCAEELKPAAVPAAGSLMRTSSLTIDGRLPAFDELEEDEAAFRLESAVLWLGRAADNGVLF